MLDIMPFPPSYSLSKDRSRVCSGLIEDYPLTTQESYIPHCIIQHHSETEMNSLYSNVESVYQSDGKKSLCHYKELCKCLHLVYFIP